MHDQLLSDHHLRHFSDPAEAARYACDLSNAIISANWLLIGAALAEQGAAFLCVDLETQDDDKTPYISRIYALKEDRQEIPLADRNMDLMARGIMENEGRISVGATALDWPLDVRLAMLAQDHLDAAHPGWNTPDAGAGTLVIDTDGRPVLSRHEKRRPYDLE